jgi:hypothetical protein
MADIQENCEACSKPWAEHTMGEVSEHAPKEANGQISQEQFKQILGLMRGKK